MTTEKSFTFYCDPGHGWLKVSQKDCAAINLHPAHFTRFSFERTNKKGKRFFYLEEDQDATLFLNQFEKVNATRPTIREKYSENSVIRNYTRMGLF